MNTDSQIEIQLSVTIKYILFLLYHNKGKDKQTNKTQVPVVEKKNAEEREGLGKCANYTSMIDPKKG